MPLFDVCNHSEKRGYIFKTFFFGFLCKYDRARSLKKGEWITVTAQIRWEQAAVYDGEGVVLYAQSVEKAQRPEDPLVYFR